MAEDTGQERTEDPTPRRKQQAKEKGQVARSRELNTMLVMLISGGALLIIGPALIKTLANIFREQLTISRVNIFDPGAMLRLFEAAAMDAFWGLVPFFFVIMTAALVGPIIMGGLTFSSKSLAFKWDKLDPIKGLSRVFAWRGLVELLKALIKFIVIGFVAIMFLYGQFDNYLGLGLEPLHQALPHTVTLLLWAFLSIASALILIAAVDVPFQIWDHNKQLKMTFQEVKDENKDTEGNPDVRSRVRRVQREMAQRRMMAEVPDADVVVTNPQHYSVALKYDQDNMGAPIVVAKGVDLMAMQIRFVARENEVPILEAPPLARALHHTTELNQEIPAGLYLAVAQVLAYVFQLKRSHKQTKKDKRKHPTMSDLPIPDDMQFDA
ncbi:MAG: flagellar biosynthesis protein FlhB [Gammaproteobacteria bacterium]|nr:flagellar biosynthesis protein FlhB [Gammaproteobacteria bacterium]